VISPKPIPKTVRESLSYRGYGLLGILVIGDMGYRGLYCTYNF